jgi:hypothetical protein
MRPAVNLALSIGLLLALTGSVSAQTAVCRDSQKPMLEAELFFGRSSNGRLAVTDGKWARFLAGEVTPRFPGGLTVIDGAGEWRTGQRTVREKSKVLLIVTRDETQSHERLTAIAEAYKQRFHQQSVGIVTRPVCASF